MFLGDVPQNVLSAAQRGEPVSSRDDRYTLAPAQPTVWPETSWSKADGATLQRFYGPDWRQILTPRVEAASCSNQAAAGGAEHDFGDLSDFDNIGEDDIVVAEGAIMSPPEEKPSRAVAAAARPRWDSQTIYADTATYPEDTLADLKSKIYAAAGIPPYRQHIFYAIDGAGEQGEIPVRTTYQLTVEGVLVLADIRRLSQDMRQSTKLDAVAGVPVDRRLEEQKEAIRVDAFDAFRVLESYPGVYIRRVFVADLATLLYSRGEDMRKAFADRYQFDLLYYGLILKYWPILSPEAFRLAIVDPGDISARFPLLDPPLSKVVGRLRAERTIIDQVYAQSKAQQVRQERVEKKGGVAVTEAVVGVEPRAAKTPVAVRNIFDWVAATQTLPAIVARIPPDAMSETVSTRGRRDYVAMKTHISASTPWAVEALERFLERPPRRPGVSYAIVRERSSPHNAPRGRVANAQPRFVFLTIFDDGRYTIESSWREDDRVGFNEVLRQLSIAAQPTIERINAMGGAALPLGGALETPSEASSKAAVSNRATIGMLTVSVFWPHALTSDGFRSMKARLRTHEQAEIIGVRGLQQVGVYAFLFRKGITRYDPRAMERVASRAGWGAGDGYQVGTNHYAYLTNPTLATRWQHIYAGRLVRIHHRTTDLQVEIVGVDTGELQRIQAYVFAFLDTLVSGPNKLARGVIQPGQARPAPEGRLRSLQEQDPMLYNLKKFDEGATVYSVLCQGARQPEIVSDEAAQALGAKRAGLVKYWNFTDNRPAYYRCPSKMFPHLSFRAGEHPLGYCIPCCKKTPALAGSKAMLVNDLCLKKHQIADEEISDAGGAVRHVLSYGKAVPVGRVSHAPHLLSGGLFYDTIPPPYVFRLVGVLQQTPSFPEAGFFYSLAAALGLGTEELVHSLAETALAVRDSYQSLAGGGAAVFASAEDLAGTIVEAFLLRGDRFSPFGPGGGAEDFWCEIIADLVHIRYDITVVEFIDDTGDGNVFFEISPSAAARLRRIRRGAGGVHLDDAIPTDIIILVTSPAGTYPLIAVDRAAFSRHGYGQGAATRFFFSSKYSEDEVPDRVVEILQDMIVSQSAAESAVICRGPRQFFDLDFITELCAAKKYRLIYRLVNLRDMCYGVILAPYPGDDALVYFPIPYAPHSLPPPDVEPSPTALYGPRPEGRYPAPALAEVLAAANESAKNKHSRAFLAPVARLEAPNGQLVGFIAAAVGDAATASIESGAGIYFHHDPTPGAGLPWETAVVASSPYNMRDIDQAIYAAGGAPASQPLLPEKEPLAQAGLYRYRLYRLFLAEFAALLQSEKNKTVRKKLAKIIAQTKFSSPGALAEFRTALSTVLRDYPDDARTVRGLIAKLNAQVGPLALHGALEEAIEATAFDFDRTTLSRLRALETREGVEAELDRLMRAQVELEDDTVSSDLLLLNMYVACSLPSSLDRPQCSRKRLRMPADRFTEYTKILAADVLNPLKSSTLGMMTMGVMDGSHFVTRPDERIMIY